MIKFGSILNNVLRRIPISHAGISLKTISKYDRDPPPVSTVVEEVNKDSFSTREDEEKKKYPN